MLNFFLDLFGVEHEIEKKKFIKAFVLFAYSETTSFPDYTANVTRFWVTKKSGKITVHVQTHRPGILIGKQGTLISKIRTYMETYCNTQIEIDIREETMFQIYS